VRLLNGAAAAAAGSMLMIPSMLPSSCKHWVQPMEVAVHATFSSILRLQLRLQCCCSYVQQAASKPCRHPAAANYLQTVIANLVSTAAKQAIPGGVLLHSPTAGSLQGTLDLQQAASFIYYRWDTAPGSQL
jgi:hypothetical protein